MLEGEVQITIKLIKTNCEDCRKEKYQDAKKGTNGKDSFR